LATDHSAARIDTLPSVVEAIHVAIAALESIVNMTSTKPKLRWHTHPRRENCAIIATKNGFQKEPIVSRERSKPLI
jgi:hypothetical protein